MKSFYLFTYIVPGEQNVQTYAGVGSTYASERAKKLDAYVDRGEVLWYSCHSLALDETTGNMNEPVFLFYKKAKEKRIQELNVCS